MLLQVATGPASEPLTDTEAIYHLKSQGLTFDADETAELQSLLKAAITMAENFTRRKFITQELVGYVDDWIVNMTLGVGPVTAIASVKYIDTAGAEQTLATTEYKTDIISQNPRIYLHGTLPDLQDDAFNRVRVYFSAGYANAAAVPEDIKSAIKLILGHLWENRQDVVLGTQVNKLPKASEYLLFPYIIWA
jgi:uncharacterized phiE125 gp8 family phage protein